MNDAKDAGTNLFLASLDASKAFDVVNHASLLRRLYHLDIQPVIWSILKHLYDGSQCPVKSRGGLSDPFTLHQGVHQGRVTLTDLYKLIQFSIDPILHRLEENKLGARIGSYYVGAPTCADDIVLAAHNPNQLQEMLSELVIFSERERYKLHPQKVIQQLLEGMFSVVHEWLFNPGIQPDKTSWNCKKFNSFTKRYYQRSGQESYVRSYGSSSPWSKWPKPQRSMQARSQDRFWGGAGPPKSGLFWTSPPLPYPPTKTPFLAHFVAKSGPFGRFGGCVAPPAPPPPLATGLEAWKLIDTFVEPRYLYGLEIMGLTDANKRDCSLPEENS